MSTSEAVSGAPGVASRALAMLQRPSQEWPKIQQEPATVPGLYLGYICILAALPALAQLVQWMTFGVGIPGVAVVKPGLIAALVSAGMSYVLSLVMVYVGAMVIAALATSVGGAPAEEPGPNSRQVQALKTIAYAMTATWLASVLALLPWVGGVIAIGGLVWSIILLRGGLIHVMKAAADKALVYLLAVVGAMIVIGIVVGMATAAITAPILRGGMFGSAPTQSSTKVEIGGVTVDTGKLETAAKEMEEAAKRIEQQYATGPDGLPVAKGPPVDLEALKAYAPSTVLGLPRTRLGATATGVAGVGVVEADYQSGERSVEISIGEMGAFGAFAGMAGAMGVEQSEETATGFSKAGTINGRFTQQQEDRSAKTASYSVIVGNRFLVKAEGVNVTLAEVKSVVDGMDLARLERTAQ